MPSDSGSWPKYVEIGEKDVYRLVHGVQNPTTSLSERDVAQWADELVVDRQPVEWTRDEAKRLLLRSLEAASIDSAAIDRCRELLNLWQKAKAEDSRPDRSRVHGGMRDYVMGMALSAGHGYGSPKTVSRDELVETMTTMLVGLAVRVPITEARYAEEVRRVVDMLIPGE